MALSTLFRVSMTDKYGFLIDLSHAVDVYSEWVDACDEVANPKEKTASRPTGAARSSQANRGRYDEEDELGGYGGGERSRPAVTGNDDDDPDEDP